MRKINKKVFLIIVGFLLIGVIFVFMGSNDDMKNYDKIGRILYNDAINAYLRIDADYDKEYIEKEDGYAAKYFAIKDRTNMYKINNFIELVDDVFKEEALDDYKKTNDVLIIDDIYYISSTNLTLDKTYIKTDVKTKKSDDVKVVFEAISYFCDSKKCDEKDYDMVVNNFEIIKDNEKWYVSKFTFPQLEK